MNKIITAIIAIITVSFIMLLSSTAWFTDTENVGTYAFRSGTLAVDMECIDAEESSPYGLLSEEDTPWVPGDYRGTILRITNNGSLDARWRLGVISEASSSEPLMDEIVLSFYQRGEDGSWSLIKSAKLDEFLVGDNADRWIYDKALAGDGELEPLKAGQSEEILLVVDFELTAQKPLQNAAFAGNLILQGAQAAEEEWFPAEEVALDIEGGQE